MMMNTFPALVLLGKFVCLLLPGLSPLFQSEDLVSVTQVDIFEHYSVIDDDMEALPDIIIHSELCIKSACILGY